MFPLPGLQHSGFWETLGVHPNMFPLPGLQLSGFWETMGYNPTCSLTLAYSIVDSGKHCGYNPKCSLSMACNRVDSEPGLGVQPNPTQPPCNIESNVHAWRVVQIVEGVAEQCDSSEACKNQRGSTSGEATSGATLSVFIEHLSKFHCATFTNAFGRNDNISLDRNRNPIVSMAT